MMFKSLYKTLDKDYLFYNLKDKGQKGQFGQVFQDIYEPNPNEELNAWYITYGIHAILYSDYLALFNSTPIWT